MFTNMKAKLWIVFMIASGFVYIGYFITLEHERFRYVGKLLKDLTTSRKLDISVLRESAGEINLQTPSLITIFTSFKKDPAKIPVYNNTLYNWRHLAGNKESVKLILFNGNEIDKLLKDTAIKLGWVVLDIPRVNKFGTPYFKDMYQKACNMYDSIFCGFSNGDMIFGDGFERTFYDILQLSQSFVRILVIGQRSNIIVNNKTRLYDPKMVDAVVKKEGKLDTHLAEDYFFIYKNNFPWDKLPDVVIGRVAYDNYIVRMAIVNKITVIDVTRTVNAVHQTDKEGIRTGHNGKIPDKSYNNKVLGGFNYMGGSVLCSQYISQFTSSRNNSKVTINMRTGKPNFCKV